MIFRQFYLPSLGHASYLIGSEQTGEALVLDVRRDVGIYFDAARADGLRIAYACDTHQHNDYVTGICELPARADIQLLAGARAQLAYPVRRMDDRSRLEMGEVVFETLHTPGHTPEHIALLVTDRSRSPEPMLLLSGGALLAGDVARPDLLGSGEQVQRNIIDLCLTLRQTILRLPDHVEVYPTHVAGSLCGGHIARRLSTTVGYERKANAVLASLEAGLTDMQNCLAIEQLPAVPPYWRRMRRLNADGPPLLGVLRDPPALPAGEVERLCAQGALLLDCRSPEAFHSHIPGALNAGLGNFFPTWAGTILPADAEVVLVLERAEALWEACWELLRIGYPLPKGWLAGGMRAWRLAGRPLEFLPQWTVHDLHSRRERERDLTIVDVRQPQEWAEGHITGALHVTGAQLHERLDEVPRNRTVAVICGSGYRSSVAASLLQHLGYRRVVNVLGGMTGWKAAGFEITR